MGLKGDYMLKFKTHYIMILTVLFIQSLLISISAAEAIKFGANESYPYWSSVSKSGGMASEIVDAIFEEADLRYQIEFAPLKRLIDDDENNDLGNPEFYMKTQDFAEIIPIAIYSSSFIYYQPHHKEKIIIHSIEDLKAYKVGALKGTQDNHSYFLKSGIAFEASYSQESLIKKLKFKRIDLSVNIELVAKTVIKKLYPDEIGNFKFIPIKGSNSTIAIMISEEQPNAHDIALKIRSGLDEVIKNGRYQKIVEKYYGVGNMPVSWYDDLIYFHNLYNFEE